MKKIVAFLIFTFSIQAFCYVATRTEYNQKLHWESRSTSLDIYVNPVPEGYNSTSITSQDIQTIMNEVAQSWSAVSPYSLDVSYTQNLPSLGTGKTVRFSSDSSYFGSGVLAVTTVSHSASTGKIYSADILVNGSASNPNMFTADKSVSGGYYAYIGDALSHEIGHFMGLGHSDVFGSSMVFSVFKGQHIPHSDDKAGLEDLYSHLGTGGTISGSVITGNGIQVFGAHVQAISYKTGKAVAGVFSESDGTFTIKDLPKNDSYLIYVLPPRGIDNLPVYYQSIQTRFCSGRSFVPSFYTKCGASEKGKPQVISLESESHVSIGAVSVRCDESVNPSYLYSKVQQAEYEVQRVTRFNKDQLMGATHVGYFSSEEITKENLGSGDELVIDFTEYNVETDTNYYLNIKLITKEIGSAIGLYAHLYDYNDNLVATKDLGYGSFNERETDLEFDLLLSTNSLENRYKIKLFPRDLSTNEANELFASKEVMTNTNATYLMLTSVKYFQNGVYQTYALKNSFPYEDNYYCTEGEATVTARPNALNSSVVSSESSGGDVEQGLNAMSCGTIDIDQDGNSSGGMMSFTLGALLALLFGLARRKSNDFFV